MSGGTDGILDDFGDDAGGGRSGGADAAAQLAVLVQRDEGTGALAGKPTQVERRFEQGQVLRRDGPVLAQISLQCVAGDGDWYGMRWWLGWLGGGR